MQVKFYDVLEVLSDTDLSGVTESSTGHTDPTGPTDRRTVGGASEIGGLRMYAVGRWGCFEHN